MAWSLVYILTLVMVLIATLRSGALFRLLILLAVSVIATLALALMKYDEHVLWAGLIVPPAILLTTLAFASAFDRITCRAWHVGS
ncbi:hypothetical protein [Rhizobium sp.]|uniref:hypothetical protein n=1 Tax=Rhizobium sp. TaxID=391 RepID=UPI0028A20746